MPAPPRQMSSLSKRSDTSGVLGLVDDDQVELPADFPAKIHHNVARPLNVDGTLHHRHEPFSERHEIGRDVGILVAERTGMNARHPEPGGLVEPYHLVAH